MFKNNFDIIRILGVMVTSIGLFIISIIIEEYIDYSNQYNQGSFYTDQEIGIGLVILLGFAGGLGMIFAKKWARTIITIMIAFGTLIILFLVITEGNLERNPIMGIGKFILIPSIAGGILLIFYNQKIESELGNASEEEHYDDILDRA